MSNWKNAVLCVICRKKFVPDKFHPKQRTCGEDKCVQKMYRLMNKEKRRIAGKIYRENKWFGGKRDDVLKRDITCVRCHGLYPELFGDRLTVHHIDGDGRGSKCPNNVMSNLITLCNYCHAQIHSNPKYDKYLAQVQELIKLSNREIGRRIGISHPTVAKARRELEKMEGSRV